MDGYLLSTLLCRTRAAPGLPARTRTRANPHHARAHALVTLPSGPATALYTMGPAHAPATGSHLGPPSITSPPQVTPPRRPHPHRSPQPSRDALPTRHDSLRHPQAVAAHHEPTMTARSQPARSGSGLALLAPASRAAHTGPDRRTPPPAPHASRCHRLATPPATAAGLRTTRRLPRPGKLLSTMLTQGLATGAGRPPRVRMDPSLQGHHSLGSVGDPPLQGHHAHTHRGILRCSVQIRCQTNYISPSMRSQQVQVGPD
jgi:hypothetical protein